MKNLCRQKVKVFPQFRSEMFKYTGPVMKQFDTSEQQAGSFLLLGFQDGGGMFFSIQVHLIPTSIGLDLRASQLVECQVTQNEMLV